MVGLISCSGTFVLSSAMCVSGVPHRVWRSGHVVTRSKCDRVSARESILVSYVALYVYVIGGFVVFGIPVKGFRFGRHWDDRDAGSCITRVASMGCPASPLGSSSVGLSGDAQGLVIPVLAFSSAYLYSVCGVLSPALGGAAVK